MIDHLFTLILNCLVSSTTSVADHIRRSLTLEVFEFMRQG